MSQNVQLGTIVYHVSNGWLDTLKIGGGDLGAISNHCTISNKKISNHYFRLPPTWNCKILLFVYLLEYHHSESQCLLVTPHVRPVVTINPSSTTSIL